MSPSPANASLATPSLAPRPRPVVLCILDGWGLRAETEANAVALARTPTYDRLRADVPMATLKTSGEDVGLIPGQMGNSEVGHTNIGAGRVVWMDLPRINNELADQSDAIAGFVGPIAETAQIHLMGLMSPGGVHSHQDHIVGLVDLLQAARGGRGRITLHLFLDGRDTPPKSALGSLADLNGKLVEVAARRGASAEIATISGRYYAMDRDTRWERVSQAWRAIVRGEGEQAATAQAAIEAAYARGETDEFVLPTGVDGFGGVGAGDGLMMANFRADRAREILSALLDPAFNGFDRGGWAPGWAATLGMVEYSTELNAFMPAIFPQDEIPDTLGAWVARHGKIQLRLAETEKYPHVTFFLNGGVETPSDGETRHMAPSPKVATYDLQPEMSAAEVTEALTKAIGSGDYDLIVVNYANPDMVGHTGDLSAAITAVETVDAGVGAAWAAVEAAGGAMLVTADHGNCEMMVDPETGGPHTAHTTNPVPVFLIAGDAMGLSRLRDGGRLADVAPTLLELMGLPQPAAMTGRSLIVSDA